MYESLDEFKLVCSSHRFRCPSCNEISHEPFFCSSEAKPKCNWKAYGLQGCLGKGHRFAIKDTFLANPKVHEIFMPVELEH
ncbi:hypothetical protein SVI_1971 [Shewanella violacea DSS12]|uniref:Uncharacterized protein n=1 Tax=Shewanella violacea (strain JCM 10179 / CIP 106290 / LMG 19151 / DSS12) TaxID=637905 RepID=D4ZJU3_SHEVD|nr:hypothetical protein SVI_1971 [Shewanella violacea DSS12]